VWAGGVEESEFFLFSVVFPVRCISSISPRFYFRKHAFCFLPLVAILESPFFRSFDQFLTELFLELLSLKVLCTFGRLVLFPFLFEGLRLLK
jgi:hypothetical protein